MKPIYSYVEKNDKFYIYEHIKDYHKLCLKIVETKEDAKKLISFCKSGKGFNGFTPTFFAIKD